MKLRVALAQINPTVGDLAGNAALISKYANEAHAASADVVVFPEMVLEQVKLYQPSNWFVILLFLQNKRFGTSLPMDIYSGR